MTRRTRELGETVLLSIIVIGAIFLPPLERQDSLHQGVRPCSKEVQLQFPRFHICILEVAQGVATAAEG